MCNFGPLLKASLRLFLEIVGCLSCPEHVWEESFNVLGLWIWPESVEPVVFLASEELGAWPKRLPDEYGHGIWN